MEDKEECSDTDTVPIPVLDVERKTLPMFCPWYDIIVGVAKIEVLRFEEISPAYKACRKCQDFINEGKSFLGGGMSA